MLEHGTPTLYVGLGSFEKLSSVEQTAIGSGGFSRSTTNEYLIFTADASYISRRQCMPRSLDVEKLPMLLLMTNNTIFSSYDRWRALGGEDLSTEQLEAAIMVSQPAKE